MLVLCFVEKKAPSGCLFDENGKRKWRSVGHKYMHYRFWNKDSFEKLI